MFPYNRLDEIFNYIRKHDYISPERLVSIFKITDRTIRNDIQEINDVLKLHGASVKLKRKYGYYLEITSQEEYQTFIQNLEEESHHVIELDSSKDRIRYILKRLLSSEDYIEPEDIMEQVCISKNTLNNYIKSIKNMISKYDLEYIAKANAGIKIIGTEEAKRRCIVEHVLSSNFENYITGFTKEERNIFQGIDLDYLRDMTLSYLNKNFIKTSDFNVKNLMIHLALMIARVRNNHYINMANVKTDEGVMEIVDSMCEEIENYYDIAISKGEKLYIYLHLIANTHMDVENINDDQLRAGISDMLRVIYDSYNFDLRSDEILQADLFRHLKSIFTSKTYALNSRNPLLETIKNNYPLAFEITLTSSSRVFTKEPYTLSEEDVGYVSLHIGAAIERCFSRKLQKKNVLLVCGSGQATTRMLETRLTLYFPDKIQIVRCVSYNEFTSYKENDFAGIDFVISTISVKCEWVPAITVNFSLTNKDVETISQFLTRIEVNKMQQMGGFFDERLFFRLPKAQSKKEVIELLYERMRELDIVDERFLDSVMRREELGNTNMDEVFAIPHPMELCAKSTKVAVALLDEPLLWKEKDKVQIVFLLAIKQGVQKDIEHLYDVFIEIVNDTKLQQNILHSQNYQQFLSVLGCV